ncbi:MAG: transglutaminase domain-containing protein [Ruminococcaceae bacterium]|nr:transglutaminase domain-containing protein [Oscillospiraceae bacterium]
MLKRTTLFLSLIILVFLLSACVDITYVTTAETSTSEIISETAQPQNTEPTATALTTTETATVGSTETSAEATELSTAEVTTIETATAEVTEPTATTTEEVTEPATTVATTAETTEITTTTTTVVTTAETTTAKTTEETTTAATTVATTAEITTAATTTITTEAAEDNAPAEITFLPKASGKATKVCDSAIIDYSNISSGYVMVQFTADTDTRLKVQVKCKNNTYTYNISPKEWTVLPLSEGNGEYTVTIFQNVSGSKYATVLSQSVNANIKDETSVFLYPNQYVDYSVAKNAVAKAASLTKGKKNPLDKVAAIYDFVINTLTYDTEKAQTVKSGYLPVLDEVLKAKKGICFDYAALMAGMLRSQGVPCKLVVGYAGEAYHAWINVWSENEGWINAVIFFNGTTWERMDPTFASASNGSGKIEQFIGDGKNYTVKYLY